MPEDELPSDLEMDLLAGTHKTETDRIEEQLIEANIYLGDISLIVSKISTSLTIIGILLILLVLQGFGALEFISG